MRGSCLGLVVALVSCSAEPRAPAAAAPVHTAAAPAEPEAPAERAAPAKETPSLDAAVSAFLAAANSDDDAGARALCTPECWSKECASFAGQAGKKFQARASGPPRQVESRAVVPVDVICPGERKCDFVHLLFQLGQSGWQVADVTEDDAKGKAWAP